MGPAGEAAVLGCAGLGSPRQVQKRFIHFQILVINYQIGQFFYLMNFAAACLIGLLINILIGAGYLHQRPFGLGMLRSLTQQGLKVLFRALGRKLLLLLIPRSTSNHHPNLLFAYKFREFCVK